VRRIDLALYAIAGATAGLAGIICSARIGAGQVTAGGTSTTLIVITAVLIGGVSLMGGMGSVQGGRSVPSCSRSSTTRSC